MMRGVLSNQSGVPFDSKRKGYKKWCKALMPTLNNSLM